MHGARGDYKPTHIGERKVQQKQYYKRKIVIPIRVNIIIEQKSKEYYNNTKYASHESALQLFESRFSKHIPICSLHNIESNPQNRKYNNATPKVGILKHCVHIVERAVFYAKLSVEEKPRPCYKSRQVVAQNIFEYLQFLIHHYI
jgi:hypothetical protein